jgi:hypothetical protein
MAAVSKKPAGVNRRVNVRRRGTQPKSAATFRYTARVDDQLPSRLRCAANRCRLRFQGKMIKPKRSEGKGEVKVLKWVQDPRALVLHRWRLDFRALDCFAAALLLSAARFESGRKSK